MNDGIDQNKNLLNIPHYKILSLIGFATLLGWGGFLLVIFKLDPWGATELALTLFYSSTLTAFAGTFTIILFFLKKWKTHDHVYIKHLTISLRQGVLLSLCTNICLALLMLGLLRVWNGLLIVIIMTLIEFYLSGKDELN